MCLQTRLLAACTSQEVLQLWDSNVATAAGRNVPIDSKMIQLHLASITSSKATLSAARHRPPNLSSDSNNWYTPETLLAAARATLQDGEIDLDPCSDALAQASVRAKQYFHFGIDTMSVPWRGRVFVNPPFGMVHGKS